MKTNNTWESWYAWHPIFISKKFVWFKKVERLYVHEIDRELLGYGRAETSYWKYREVHNEFA